MAGERYLSFRCVCVIETVSSPPPPTKRLSLPERVYSIFITLYSAHNNFSYVKYNCLVDTSMVLG